MKQLGGLLISIALGIAVDHSHLEGVWLATAAWTVVVIGIALSIAALVIELRRHIEARLGVQSVDPRPLDGELSRLGHEILDFVRAREREEPNGTGRFPSHVRHPMKSGRERRAARAFAQDTLTLYTTRFATEVRLLLRQVVGVRIGRNEVAVLLSVKTLADVSDVAWRLIELGRSDERPIRRAA